MAYKHATLIDNGPVLLATRAATTGRIVERLLSAYSNGDSLGTVTTNTIAGPTARVAGDFTIAAGSGSGRDLTIAAKSHTLAVGVTSPVAANIHRAFVDTVSSEVLFVIQAASIGGDAAPWAIGGTVAVGAVTEHFGQPT